MTIFVIKVIFFQFFTKNFKIFSNFTLNLTILNFFLAIFIQWKEETEEELAKMVDSRRESEVSEVGTPICQADFGPAAQIIRKEKNNLTQKGSASSIMDVPEPEKMDTTDDKTERPISLEVTKEEGEEKEHSREKRENIDDENIILPQKRQKFEIDQGWF